MHRNPSKVVCLYCHQPAPFRALFTMGYQLKNDFFCSASILAPLMAFKTQTNIQKHLGILKYTTQGPESTIFGHLDHFLARITAVYNPSNGHKNWVFVFCSISFQFFPYHWPETCANELLHQNTPLGSPTAPYLGIGSSLKLWKWPYPALEMDQRWVV